MNVDRDATVRSFPWWFFQEWDIPKHNKEVFLSIKKILKALEDASIPTTGVRERRDSLGNTNWAWSAA